MHSIAVAGQCANLSHLNHAACGLCLVLTIARVYLQADELTFGVLLTSLAAILGMNIVLFLMTSRGRRLVRPLRPSHSRLMLCVRDHKQAAPAASSAICDVSLGRLVGYQPLTAHS